MTTKVLLDTVVERQHGLVSSLSDIMACTSMSNGDCIDVIYSNAPIRFEYSSTSTSTATVSTHPFVLTPDNGPGRWVEKMPSSGDILMEFDIGDETTDLQTGTAVMTKRAPFAFTLTDVRASVNTAPSGANLIIDINESGTSVLSTKLTIDKETAATGTVQITAMEAGSIDSVTVDSVEITDGLTVAFDTDIATTATALAANIQAHTSSPNYNAAAVDDTVTITAVTVGDSVNDFVVASSGTTVTTVDTDMSGATSDKTSVLADTAAVISDSTIADDAEISIDIDQIGSTNAGDGLKVKLYGVRS